MKQQFDIGGLERLLNRPLSDEESAIITQWERGRALTTLTHTQGWDVLVAMLADYVRSSVTKLVQIDPAKHDEILAEQAVAFSLSRQFNLLMEDIEKAIEASRQTPEVIKEQLKHATGAPPIGV